MTTIGTWIDGWCDTCQATIPDPQRDTQGWHHVVDVSYRPPGAPADIDGEERHDVQVETVSVPKRIQRRRTKGWRMPEGAVYVGRPTKWGNPFEVARCIDPTIWCVFSRLSYVEVGKRYPSRAAALPEAVRRYRNWARRHCLSDELLPLAGRDLACWCPLSSPCHVDVLLELANAPAERHGVQVETMGATA